MMIRWDLLKVVKLETTLKRPPLLISRVRRHRMPASFLSVDAEKASQGSLDVTVWSPLIRLVGKFMELYSDPFGQNDD